MVSLVFAGAEPKSGLGDWDYKATPDEQRALASIRAASLRGHLSFIAADALQGRPTPSLGQSVAAEYIAAQFRRSGLEPGAGDSYFQTCRIKGFQANPEGFRLNISGGEKTVEISPPRFDMDSIREFHLNRAPLVKVPLDRSAFRHLRGLMGKVVMTEFPHPSSKPSESGNSDVTVPEFLSRLAGFGPSLLVTLDRDDSKRPDYFNRLFLTATEPHSEKEKRRSFPTVTLNDPKAVSNYDAMITGETGSTLSMKVGNPIPRELVLRNVVGLLRGTDPLLRDTCVILSAHYDGTGPMDLSSQDRIWNAANDDGSGTVALIEIASALASLEQKPKRSILFIAFFGEERDFLGSRCYVENPSLPLDRVAANINLEQLGRTDSLTGDQRHKVVMTGFDYSEITGVLTRAGELTGITVTGVDASPDPYFARSDNVSFAEQGVPAHTVCVALEYPDYHGSGDAWEKIDYSNMEQTSRMIALAVLMLAQSPDEPVWNAGNSHARPFLHVWRKRHTR